VFDHLRVWHLALRPFGDKLHGPAVTLERVLVDGSHDGVELGHRDAASLHLFHPDLFQDVLNPVALSLAPRRSAVADREGAVWIPFRHQQSR